MRLTEPVPGANLPHQSVIEFKPAQGGIETGSRLVAHSEKGEFMSEKRADQFEPGNSDVAGKSAYEAPVAEWHDLRVITLGGTPGANDSGNPENESPQDGSGSGDGARGSVGSYDDDDDFGNFA